MNSTDKEKDEIILACNEYLKSVTDSRFVFGGTYGLYMQGIDLGREFHDIDVKFLDLNKEEIRALDLNGFTPTIDRLPSVDFDLDYKEIKFKRKKILVFTPETIIDCKRRLLDWIENEALIMDEARIRAAEKIRRDLNYLKENYNLE